MSVYSAAAGGIERTMISGPMVFAAVGLVVGPLGLGWPLTVKARPVIFKYDWSQFDAKTGLIFMIGVLLVFNVMGDSDFAWFAAGTSALLAWCTIFLVPPQSRRRDLTGLGVYLVAGAALTWLAVVISSSTVALIIAMFVVTFGGYMMLLKGAHAFMVAWCVVYWFMLVPLFMRDQGLGGILYGHVIGTGMVIALNVLKPLWAGKSKGTPPEAEPSEPAADEEYSLGYMVRYAGIVATSIAGGTALGTHWLTADPTVIANATLNIISPSFTQVWRAAVERVVLASLGIIIGFYLGWFFPGELFGHLLTAVTAFAALAVTRVSFGLLIGFLFIMIAYPWGVMHSDAGHLIANEKLIGELIGIVIAVVAIGLLTRLKKTDPV